MKNKTIGTVVPPDVENGILYLVEEGFYQGKSDFIHQAIIEKLDREHPRPKHRRPTKEETEEIGNKIWNER